LTTSQLPHHSYLTTHIIMNRWGLLLLLLGLCAASLAKSPYCEHNDCENGGTCRVAGDGTEFCTCHEDYHGVHCEKYTASGRYCEQVKCKNGGTCIEKEATKESEESYFCTCHEGYWGNLCQFADPHGDRCEQMKCQNGGTCIEKEATKESEESFKCYCKSGYTGQFCQHRSKDD